LRRKRWSSDHWRWFCFSNSLVTRASCKHRGSRREQGLDGGWCAGPTCSLSRLSRDAGGVLGTAWHWAACMPPSTKQGWCRHCPGTAGMDSGACHEPAGVAGDAGGSSASVSGPSHSSPCRNRKRSWCSSRRR
jgi:hypothetical protein